MLLLANNMSVRYTPGQDEEDVAFLKVQGEKSLSLILISSAY